MFMIFQSKEDKQWYWRLEANNSRIVATGGEGYTDKSNCNAGLLIARQLAFHNKFAIFQSDKNNQWYWRLKAGNNQIVAIGHEGYTTESDCQRATETDHIWMRSNILIDMSVGTDRARIPLSVLADPV